MNAEVLRGVNWLQIYDLLLFMLTRNRLQHQTYAKAKARKYSLLEHFRITDINSTRYHNKWKIKTFEEVKLYSWKLIACHFELFQRRLQFIRHNNKKNIISYNCVRAVLKLNVRSAKIKIYTFEKLVRGKLLYINFVSEFFSLC